jgi:sugar O-acyltransferase (sialic acid O-acetyltransferase NeuD family)
MKKMIIFGTGTLARLAYIHFSDEGQYEVIAFTVNENYIVDDGDTFGLKIVPFEKIEQIYPPDTFSMFVAIGTKRANKARAQIYNDCKAKGYELASCLNTRVNQLKYVKTGDNCLVMPSVIVQPYAELGNDVIVWSGSYVGFQSRIGDHSYIAAAAVVAGNVKVGQYCFVGANATIKDGLTLAPESIVGAGAIILEDTETGKVYGGQGAEIIHRSSSELRYFK